MDINQFLTEKVLNQCWHEIPTSKMFKSVKSTKKGFRMSLNLDPTPCNKCHKHFKHPNFHSNRNFSTPTDCLYLIIECSKMEWWGEFLDNSKIILHEDYATCNYIRYGIDINALLDLPQIGEAIARFHGFKEE